LWVYKTFGDVLYIPEFYRRARGERKSIESSAWIETVFLIKNSPINQSINPTKERKKTRGKIS
jgi:hypothetical protein